MSVTPRLAEPVLFGSSACARKSITSSRVDGKLDGWGGGPLGGPAEYDLNRSEKTHGALVLDLIERTSGRLVYRATSEKDISSKDTSPKRLNAVLKEMTKPLPGQ